MEIAPDAFPLAVDDVARYAGPEPVDRVAGVAPGR